MGVLEALLPDPIQKFTLKQCSIRDESVFIEPTRRAERSGADQSRAVLHSCVHAYTSTDGHHGSITDVISIKRRMGCVATVLY